MGYNCYVYRPTNIEKLFKILNLMKLDLISNKNTQSGFIYGNVNNAESATVNKNDEYYTPRYAILPIVKHIKNNSTIWCPFDTDDSNYVKLFRELGHNVINTHIFNGVDFFSFVPDFEYDYIISNPPYSMKYEVFNRLFEIGKPFAMLVGVFGLFENQKRYSLFRSNEFEIMYFNKRVSYFKSYTDQKPSLNPPFSSVYITSKMLPDRIMFETINNKK